jgi:hypothetical protein
MKLQKRDKAMKSRIRRILLTGFLLYGAITLACNIPKAAVEGAYGDEGVEESLFLIEEFRIDPEMGLPGEFTLIIEDYDYFDDGDGGANSIDCDYTYGNIGTFDGDDFRKDTQGNYLRDMSENERFTRKFEAARLGEFEVYCQNPGLHAIGNFQVAIQFSSSDCQEQYSISEGMVLSVDNSGASSENKKLSCHWANGETTSAGLKVQIEYVSMQVDTKTAFDEAVKKAKDTSAYCRSHATPQQGVDCACDEKETSESEYYRRERSGGCLYDSGLVTKDLEIEEVIIYRYRFVIHISSQEHNTDKLLYPSLHETALAQTKAFIDVRYPDQ